MGGLNLLLTRSPGCLPEVATIIVRASTENVASDVERALDDGIQSVKVSE